MDFDSTERVVLKNYLEHHGVKGQKWGVRRYQRPDGSLTMLGRIKYNASFMRAYDKAYKDSVKTTKAVKKAVKKGQLSPAKLRTGIEIWNESANRWNELYRYKNRIKTIEDLRNDNIKLGNIQANNNLLRRALNGSLGKQVLPEVDIKLVKAPTKLKFDNGENLDESAFDINRMNVRISK